MYTYIVRTTIVLLLIVISTNLFFFQYEVSRLTAYRQKQLEDNADTWISRMEIQYANAHHYMREIFSSSEQLYIQYSEQYPVWEFYEAVTAMQEKLNFFTASETWAQDIGLIFKNKDLVITGNSGLDNWNGTKRKEQFDQLEYVQRLRLMPVGDEVYFLDFRESALLKPSYTDLSVLLYVRINKDEFIKSICEYMGNDLRGFRILGPDGEQVISYVQQEDASEKLYQVERKIGGTQNTICFDFYIPKYEKAILLACGIMAVSVLAAIIGAVWYTLKTKKIVHTPVMKLVHAFQEFEAGNYKSQLKGDETEEFAYLYEEIDKVIHRLKESIEKEYEQKIALQESEFKQYQLQIDPHFLYNGFYNIQRMCSNGHEEKAALLSRRMASYYRYITRNGISFVPLDQEIRHMEDYISIQSIRFNDRICTQQEYNIENPKEIRVPRLIFQPIVENVYEHAFETIEADGKMQISVTVENNVLIGIVEDSGEGMTPQEIQQKNEQFDSDSGYTECTGILNVNKRLKIYYGAGSGVHYESGKELGGLRVVIRIELDKKLPEWRGSDGQDPFSRR